jgi:hypothetical protein
MKYIHIIARVFSNEDWADEFLNKGKLYCNTLNYFRTHHDEYDNNIKDPYEGLCMRISPDDGVEIKLNGSKLDDVQELLLHSNTSLNKNIFCLYAPNSPIDEQGVMEKFEDLIKITDDAKKLGDYLIVIKDAKAFNSRLVAKAKEMGLGVKMRLLDYRDFSGSIIIDEQDVGFVKPNQYSHQKECRIMIDNGCDVDEPFEVEIGSIADIAFKININDFNDGIKVIHESDASKYLNS